MIDDFPEFGNPTTSAREIPLRPLAERTRCGRDARHAALRPSVHAERFEAALGKGFDPGFRRVRLREVFARQHQDARSPGDHRIERGLRPLRGTRASTTSMTMSISFKYSPILRMARTMWPGYH